MKPKRYYINNIKLFINEYFPGTSGVLITGSFNTPYFNERSDLDLVLISDWHRDSFVESYDYNGIKMQVIMLPLHDIDGVIYRDIARGRGAIISMLSKGLILKDRNHLFERLKQQCTVLYERGPMSTQKEVLDRNRVKITSCIEDLEGTENIEDQIFIILEAYNNALRLFMHQKQLWDYDGKAASRELKYRDKDFHHKYIASLNKFFQTHDKNEALTFLKETVQDCGGELHFSSTRNFKEIYEGNILVIHIQPCSRDTECKEVQNLKEKLCTFLYNHIKNIQCLSFVYPINGLYPPGAYIIIKSERHLLEEYIIPKVKLFHLKNPDSMQSGILDNWQYPFNLNPIETFGTNDIQEKIYDHLCFIHKTYKEKSFNETLTDDIRKVVFILKHYRYLKSLHEEELWKKFWNMIFSIYIKTHLNKMLPTSNLEYIAEIKKGSILKEYESSYRNNPIATQPLDIVSTQLCAIEQYYMTHEKDLEITVYSSFYADKTEQLFYVFFKLIDITLDMFFITEKALVAYILLNE